MSTLVPLLIMAVSTTLLGACLGLRGCICACVFSVLSLITGLWAVA